VSAVRRHIETKDMPAGYNIGINVGEAAGQTVAHAHLHVIPRHQGDVPDPRGGIRWVIPAKAKYWETP
jgi:diadenosine tetraphosphate (Ap4A) HIT family hydrolase